MCQPSAAGARFINIRRAAAFYDSLGVRPLFSVWPLSMLILSDEPAAVSARPLRSGGTAAPRGAHRYDKTARAVHWLTAPRSGVVSSLKVFFLIFTVARAASRIACIKEDAALRRLGYATKARKKYGGG